MCGGTKQTTMSRLIELHILVYRLAFASLRIFAIHNIMLLAHIMTFVKKKTRGHTSVTTGIFFLMVYDYIIPIPAPPAGIAGASSLMFATADSVVRSVDATDVAF